MHPLRALGTPNPKLAWVILALVVVGAVMGFSVPSGVGMGYIVAAYRFRPPTDDDVLIF